MNWAIWAERLRVPICAALLLGAWQLVYALGVVPEKYFPSIPTIATAFWAMLNDGTVLSAWAVTFGRATVGLIGAALLGVALAIISDLSPVLSRGIRYISDVLQPIPPAAFVPMAVFMLGLGTKLYAFVIILVTIWPPYLNGVAALAGVGSVQLNTGRMFGLTNWQLLWQVKLPAALPEIFTGIRYAATISLIAVIVAEMLAGRDGIGFMIFKKAFALRTPEVFGLMFLVGLNGVLLNGLVNLLRQGLTGWHIKMMERPE
ncbi:ABC transporter permease [Cypionkella psychrotolerans]|uniref:ABC transporter permease n=1 Tax=Cypionkella psychrotolerans TaxID=1678131 RepID=UPI0006B6022A|nr:ABC transporter permease subunit [Cypionkella psychrotolerans]